MIPGEIFPASGEIILNKDRAAISLRVANTGDRPIQVGSHYHFAETNAALAFDRRAALGYRLDIPAGTAVGLLANLDLFSEKAAPLLVRLKKEPFGKLVDALLDLSTCPDLVIFNRF